MSLVVRMHEDLTKHLWYIAEVNQDVKQELLYGGTVGQSFNATPADVATDSSNTTRNFVVELSGLRRPI